MKKVNIIISVLQVNITISILQLENKDTEA